MLTLFGNLESGNVHKVQMILHLVGEPYRRVDVAQTRGEPASTEFRSINPIGKVPAILFDDGDILSESGAILYFFGKETDLWPGERRRQSEVLRWLFFEQYSHEPSLSVIRYLKHFGTVERAAEKIRDLEPRALHALGVMEQRLEKNDWLACEACTLADYALYPYTRMMDDSGFRPDDFPAVNRWFTRIEDRPNFVAMGQDGARETIAFSDYLSRPET
jgi:glutathione S-transferase